MSVRAEYQNPAAVYQLPDIGNLQVEYDGQVCSASADEENPGYVCGDVFLKIHGVKRNYLLVPSDQLKAQVKFFKLDSQNLKVELPTRASELMSPITSDFVDVRHASDCR